MKVTMRGFIMASKTQEYSLEKHGYVDKLVFAFSHYDSSKYNPSEVAVREYEFEVEVPDGFDPRAGLVENLEREKKKITAEFQAKVTEINGQIQSLLAIEASPSEVTP